MLTQGERRRVAVIGAGIGGLSCARELARLGLEPVVFEASGRVGGRCSGRVTPVGTFDDGAQYVGGTGVLATGELPALGDRPRAAPWRVPALASDDDPEGRQREEVIGLVGLPSMQALADGLALGLDVRLHTPVRALRREGARWTVHGPRGLLAGRFDAAVLAIPAPLAVPLAAASPELSEALGRVRFAPRWVLLLGVDRALPLPAWREVRGSPIERVAAIHAKPGRDGVAGERWFVEADAHWSALHAGQSPDVVADLMLDNFAASAGRAVRPTFIDAVFWPHGSSSVAPTGPWESVGLWDAGRAIGACGDSVVASRLDLVSQSGVGMARSVAFGLAAQHGPVSRPTREGLPDQRQRSLRAPRPARVAGPMAEPTR